MSSKSVLKNVDFAFIFLYQFGASFDLFWGQNGIHGRCLSATEALVNETCRQVEILRKPEENTHFLSFRQPVRNLNLVTKT